MRRSSPPAFLACLALASGAAGTSAQVVDQTRVAPTNDLPNPYVRVEPWGDVPAGAYDERTAFIGAEEGPDGNIYLLNRCLANSCRGRVEDPILKLDASGRRLASWGSGMFDFPHGFAVDADGNVWATDQRGHQVFEFSPDGTLLMTIGERGEAGDPPLRLNEPTDVAVARDGSIFVTEGHSFASGANRVSKFAADGTFLLSWGTTGSGPGEFNVPHTLAFDSLGRVFVGDRANNRIQIFDQNGTLLDVWYQFGRPSGIAITPDDVIYVADSESWGTDNPGWKKGIRVGSARDGSVRYLIEDLESTVIEHAGAEGVGVDSRGNVYGSVVRRRMLERHEPVGGESRSDELPPEAPGHIGHLASGYDGGTGLVASATTTAGTALLHANLAAGDLSDLRGMRRHGQHVSDLLTGGERDGLRANLELLMRHAGLAGEAPVASDSQRTHATHIAQIAAATMLRAWQAEAVADRLSRAASIREASPLVARLRALLYAIAEGYDEDGDGRLALDGEAGLQQLEAHVYLLLEGEGLARVIR